MISNDVVILCGGLGKRLRSVTGEAPKVLAILGDDPFLTVILNHIQNQGFKRVILCTGYKADDVQNYYGQSYKNLELIYSKEDELLGTGGAIKNAKKLINSSPFVVLNGDSFCPIKLNKILEFHNKSKAIASITLSKVEDSQDYGRVRLDENNEITGFSEKEISASGFVNAGVYCFDEKIFELMPSEATFSLEKECFPNWVGKRFYGYKAEEAFWDIGTPERFSLAKEKFNDR